MSATRQILQRIAAAVVLALPSVSPLLAPAADLTIGGSGDGAAVIVVPDSRWMEPAAWDALTDAQKTISTYDPGKRNMVYFGARLLQEYFRKITGRSLDIARETEWEKQGCPAAVLVGRTRQAARQFGPRLAPENLKRSGYVAKSVPGRLLICGADAWGTYSGCAAVLEEQCGVEWFWPTELGEEVPARTELVFDRLDVTFQPAIVFASGTLDAWGARVGERPLGLNFGHSLGPKIYHAGRLTNPEWFPLLDGNRFIPGPSARDAVARWQPCMASPAARARAVTAARSFLGKNPAAGSFSLCLNDGAWSGCECEYCRAADDPPDPVFDTTPYHMTGATSARYYRFLWHVGDAIRNDFPGRVVTAYAYAGTDLPPGLPRNPGVAVSVVGTKLAWLNPEFRKWEEMRYRRWARLTPNLATYDYMYQTGYIPNYSPHIHAEAVRFLHRNGYTMYDAETFPTMARSGPRYWVQIKLCCEPESDVDALLDRWMRGMFKEAAAPMAGYYQAIEQAWTNYPYHERHTDSWSTYCFFEVQMPVITPGTIADMDRCLAQAEALARDPKVKARLAVIRKNHLPTREFVNILWRRRPYIDPVPFDDAYARLDLSEHVRNEDIFDAPAYYARHCAEDPLSKVTWNRQSRVDTPGQRLGRALDGIVDQPLRELTAAKAPPEGVGADTPEESFETKMSRARAAIAARVAAFSAEARASPELTAALDRLARRIPEIRRVDDGPRLDGVFDDACWQGLEEHQGFFPAVTNALTAAPPRHATSFKLCHDDRAFYFAVSCRQDPADIAATVAGRPDPAIAGDDRVVITLEPWQYRFRGRSGRVKISVTAGGVTVEDSVDYGAKYWSAGSRAVSRRSGDGYALEIGIPFRALLYAPERGPRLLFNMQRFVQGAAAEESSWYPLSMGDTFACVEPGDAGRLLGVYDNPTTVAVNTIRETLPLARKEWESYALSLPSAVAWPRQTRRPVAVRGGLSALVSGKYLDVQPGHLYEAEADYTGTGSCVPSLNWYSRTETGFEDVPGTPPGETRIAEGGKRLKTARTRVAAPFAADAARLRLTCTGDVRVAAVRLVPCLPLDIRVDMDCEPPRLVAGRVFSVQATLRNVSDKPIEGLEVRMGYPAGVDLRSRAVSAAATLNPGESTCALWWLTPVYAGGQPDFEAVVVAEAKGMPRIVAKARGPLAATRRHRRR